MIILEGPDGAGKTTLLHQLTEVTHLPVHPRFASSTEGPILELWGAVKQDMNRWYHQPLALYDRHPFTSEHIYGPLIRGRMRPGFDTPEASRLRHYFQSTALVIFCMPPLSVVIENLAAEDQMSGVRENIETIYNLYRGQFARWPLDYEVILYDYTVPRNYATGWDSVFMAIEQHYFNWKGQK